MSPLAKSGVVASSSILLVLALIVFADQVLLPTLVHANKTVKVPNVVGMTVESARLGLSNSSLEVKAIREAYNEKIPRGRVVTQIPYPGTDVREGRRIYLTVSKGKETIKVPDLRGKTLRDARLVLMRIGLTLGAFSFEPNENTKQGLIFAQSAEPGDDAAFGLTVNVKVSKGSDQQVVVPQVTGYTIDEAQQMLADANLVVGSITYESDGTYFSNTVLRQTPEAGTVISALTPVSLVVAE